MALGPNQTGSVLQPVSSLMGYGNSLLNQAKDNEDEKRKKAIADAAMNKVSLTPRPLNSMFGI